MTSPGGACLWTPRKTFVGLLGPLVLLAVFAAPANGYPRPGGIERVSLGMDGTDANGMSLSPNMSGDGRYVAFHSFASNLVPNDTIFPDVFVEDRTTGAISRVSVAPDGSPAAGNSFYPSLSGTGRYVGFTSSASNLVAADTNGVWDVFVRDLESGITQKASVATDGTQGNDHSSFPSVSSDGRFVAFHSPATNLVAGDMNGREDVFVRDLVAGTLERVSLNTDGIEGNGSSNFPSISADGRYVAFHSLATNFSPTDLNRGSDVFVRDRLLGTTQRVSVGINGLEPTGGSFNAGISRDGRFLLFTSSATNLVPDDSNGVWDVFLRDLAEGTTERISVGSEGAQGDQASGGGLPASVSADGRYVAFHSSATNLVSGDNNGAQDIFVRDRMTGTTQRASLASKGTEGNGNSMFTSMSADGQYVSFQSFATNLVPNDHNGRDDVFVHDRGGPLSVVGTPSVQLVPGGVDVSGRAAFSGTILAGATDPDDDGTGGPGAAAGGAELTGAALIYRPEQEDLLLRLELSSLPPAAGGLSRVLYGAELRVGETRYEVRAAADPPRTPYVALYRCTPECNEHALLTGSLGTTGSQVLVSVPLALLEATETTELTDLRAFTAAGEATSGAVHPLDDVSLASAVIPASRVELGIADASTPPEEVTFTGDADVDAGGFSGTISTERLSPGSYLVWARACLGDPPCGPARSAPVTVGELVEKIETALELTVDGRGQDMTLRARLTDLGTPSQGIEGRTIDFYSDGRLLGSAQTDEDGLAAIGVPPGHRGTNRTYGAVFEGDHLYLGSSDERPGSPG